MSLAPVLPVESRILEAALAQVRVLESAHRSELPDLRMLNSHYMGTQPLSYMAPELIVELGDRMRQVVLHWPALATDAVEERLDVDGFQLWGADGYSDDLWGIWQGNSLDLMSHQGQVDALVMRRSYLIVGARGEDDVDPSSGVNVDVPLITVESPLEVHALRDPRRGRVSSAAKWWTSPGEDGRDEDHVTLYTPNATTYLVRRVRRPDQGSEWVLDQDGAPGFDRHGVGVVPVVPLINRPRTGPDRQMGTSELAPVIPLADAACKIATDMMVGAEFHALPRRWATGVNPDDFVDETGRTVSALSRVAGRMWANEDGDVKFGQFPEAQLSNFHATIRLLADLVANVAGLPSHYLGSTADNPASADAIRSGESRLVKRVERKQRVFGEAYEQAMRIALLIRDGELPAGAARMETKWRDASTPTVAQVADAVVKKRQVSPPLISQRQAWDDLGYSAVQQSRLESDLRREADEAAARARVAATPAPADPAPLIVPR